MTTNKWSDLIELLNHDAPVVFDSGLSDTEINEIEKKYAFRFPLDLRDFLQTALPKGLPFPDWRFGDESHIREMLNAPLNGLLFDVEHGDFWMPEWGARPTLFEDAKKIVETQVDQAPRLIPIYAHRMMPDRPQAAGNPVLSVHQTDIIYYGFDLDDYFRNEFKLSGRKPWPSQIRPVEFWEVDRWQDFRWR
jgi:hypothetical protein